MKKSIFLAILLSFLSGFAFAQEPCPSAKEEAKPADPNEKCKPDLEGFAPVLFVFPDEKKPETQPADSDKAEKKTEKPVNPSARKQPETCTYSAYAWDTKKGRSTDHFTVSKPYAEVTDDERDPNAPECTICSEDQMTIDPHDFGVDVASIRICHVYAEQVKSALKEIASSGKFDIEKLEGYRPGKTRGPVDKKGLRTLWSQHSFGTAIDINANKNAIYSNCPQKLTNNSDEVKTCKRGIGGDWKPEKAPRVSIVKDGIVYQTMTMFWKWGGEIDGTTKDIMHFSITGY